MKKRVLFVGPFPPPFGGIASHLESVLPQLVRQGVEAHVLCNGEKSEIRQQDGIRIESFTIDGIIKSDPIKTMQDMATFSPSMRGFDLRDRLKYVAFSRKVYKYIKTFNIDAIFFYEIFRSFAIPYLADKGVKIPMHVMNFAEGVECPDYYRAKRIYLKRISDHAASLFSSSAYCAKAGVGVWENSKPVGVVFIGVDMSRFGDKSIGAPFRERHGIPADAVVVTYVARMSEDMGLDVVAEVIPDLLKENPKLFFIIGGAKGALSGTAERLAEENGPSVRYMPNIPFKELPAVYAASDILWAPTRDNHACMGVSIKEAMAASLPVIATRTCGIPEAVVDGVTGILTPLDGARVDVSALKRAVRELATDPARRTAMGKKGYQHALSLFDDRITASKYQKLLFPTD